MLIQMTTVVWLALAAWLGTSDSRFGFVAFFGPGFVLGLAVAILIVAATSWYRPAASRVGSILAWLVAVVAVQLVAQALTVPERGLTVGDLGLVTVLAVLGSALGIAGGVVLGAQVEPPRPH